MRTLIKSKSLATALAIFFFFFTSSAVEAKKSQGLFKQKESVIIYIKDKDGRDIASGKGVVVDVKGIIETNCYLIIKWLEDIKYMLIIKTKEGAYYELERLVSFNRRMDIATFKIAEKAVPISDLFPASLDQVNNAPTRAEIELAKDAMMNKSKEESVNAEMYFRQARHYEAEGRYAEAENAYKHALELNPEHIEALSGLGMVYYKLGRYVDAVNLYEGILKIKPDFKSAYDKLGANYIILGNYSTAADMFKKSILLDPEKPLTYFNLAIAYFLKGDKDAATDIYIKLKRLDNKLAEDLFDLLY